MTPAAKAIRAAAALLANIANSDFVTYYGTVPAYGLRDYKADIAADILKAMEERELTEEETQFLCDDNNWQEAQDHD